MTKMLKGFTKTEKALAIQALRWAGASYQGAADALGASRGTVASFVDRCALRSFSGQLSQGDWLMWTDYTLGRLEGAEGSIYFPTPYAVSTQEARLSLQALEKVLRTNDQTRAYGLD